MHWLQECIVPTRGITGICVQSLASNVTQFVSFLYNQSHSASWSIAMHALAAGVYSQLVKMDSEEKDNEISRDLNRTYPTHVFYQQSEGIGQQSLYHVLKTYSVYDKKVNPSSPARQNLPCNIIHQSTCEVPGREPAVVHRTAIKHPPSLKAHMEVPGNQT